MVISSFFLYTNGISDILSLLPKSIFNKLGICKKYFSHIILCSICGFVSGAKAISEDFKENDGNETDFSNSVIQSSNAGIGFVVGCVGVKIWNNICFGIFLFFSQIIISLVLGKLLLTHKKSSNVIEKKRNSISFSSAISKSVTSSAYTMISICAFVVAFSCFLNVFSSIISINTNSQLYAFFKILFEFCQGSFSVTQFSNIYLCAFFSGFCIGFGGLCVHFQIFSVCEGLPLNKKMFLFFKALQGLLCGFCSTIFVLISKIKPLKEAFTFNENLNFFNFPSILFFVFLTYTLAKFLFNKFF